MGVPISVVILTYNEEENIVRTLQALSAFDEIVVVDSLSSDSTPEKVKSFSGVKFFDRAFDTHTDQWNYAVSCAQNDWILSLDADYLVTPQLSEELLALNPTADAYAISFRYCISGKPLRGTILPPRLAFFNREKCTYIQDGHTQLLHTTGTIGTLKHLIYHDDRKPLDRWLWAQDRYALLEKEKMRDPNNGLSGIDRIRRKTIFAPILVFAYCYFWKRGFLDGKHGLYYALQRTYVEILLKLRLMEDSV